IRIIGTSFVGPTAARLALMLVACAGLVLQTPTPASRHLDVSTQPDVAEWQPSADSGRDREWRDNVIVSASDACNDDDDGDDESSGASGQGTSSRAYLAPDFSDSSYLSGPAEDRRPLRDRVVHLLRGPPAFPMESSSPADDDTAGTHPSASRCRVNR